METMKHALAALVALTACTTDDLVEDTETAARRADPGDPTCPTWGCGANSATVGDGLIFDELDSSGNTPNRGGLTIVGAKLVDGRAVSIHVYRHWLYAVDSAGWSYWDSSLVGTIIQLKHPVKGRYEVQVAQYHPQAVSFWTSDKEPVPAYEFRTRRLGETKFLEYACRSALTTDPDWTGPVHDAIVFQGDRYDPTYKTVTETSPSDPWFNLACAATAPAKMHLTRHTRAGSTTASGAVAYPTSVAQRQAMLKMFTADYCGTGHTFTVDGTPLSYTDRNHWLQLYSSTPQESVWTEYGAVCLDNPRYIDVQTIQDKCGWVPPPCGDVRGWESWGYVFSALR